LFGTHQDTTEFFRPVQLPSEAEEKLGPALAFKDVYREEFT
jgi:hypothetical protein